MRVGARSRREMMNEREITAVKNRLTSMQQEFDDWFSDADKKGSAMGPADIDHVALDQIADKVGSLEIVYEGLEQIAPDLERQTYYVLEKLANGVSTLVAETRDMYDAFIDFANSGPGENIGSRISNSGIGLKLDTLKIEANGQVIADFGNSEDAELLRRIQDTDPDKWQFCGGSGWDSSMGPYNYRYKYNFGLSNDTRKVYGGVATRELSNFKITVKTNDTTASATRLHVILKYAQLESIESASGKVTTSISS